VDAWIWGVLGSYVFVSHRFRDRKLIFRLRHSTLALNDANSVQFGCLHIKLATQLKITLLNSMNDGDNESSTTTVSGKATLNT